MRIRVRCCAVLVAIATLVPVTQAQAERVLVSGEAVKAKEVASGAIAGACGIAFRGGRIYVSSYYDHSLDVFNSTGGYESRIPFDSFSGPCQLATSATDALYVNDWHEGVSRVLPSPLEFDSGESTGVAVDQASGDVYVNDRTYIAVYEDSGAPVLKEGQPLRIGLGSLGDGYGLTVFGGRVYVPDASDSTVKVYEPTVDPDDPVMTITGAATPQHGFSSLADAAVVVDPANAHLLVLDNLQPGFEHPEAAIDEFDSSGAFLGQVSQKLIDAEPSALVFITGTLYATSGNAGEGAVLKFGPYTEGGAAKASEARPAASAQVALAAASAVPGPSALAPAPRASAGVKTRPRQHRVKKHARAKAKHKRARGQR